MSIFVDTSALYAALNAGDEQHRASYDRSVLVTLRTFNNERVLARS